MWYDNKQFVTTNCLVIITQTTSILKKTSTKYHENILCFKNIFLEISWTCILATKLFKKAESLFTLCD